MDLMLIQLVDMGFNRMFSDPHCSYTEPIGGSGCNHIALWILGPTCGQLLIRQHNGSDQPCIN